MSAAAARPGLAARLSRLRLVRLVRASRRKARSLAGRRRVIVMAGFGAYLAMGLDAAADSWLLVYDPSSERCLVEGVAWVVAKGENDVRVGDVWAFRPPEEAALFFPEGVIFAKRVMGVAGDVVMVTRRSTTVNGEVVAEGLDLVPLLGVPHARYERTFVVPDGHLLMMGETPMSYDGRYWGTVPIENGVGRARRLL